MNNQGINNNLDANFHNYIQSSGQLILDNAANIANSGYGNLLLRPNVQGTVDQNILF